jgi:dihydrofolate synthase/folylpolyglutamate synthase
MDSFGNPQNDFPCIHVAGSKGKGSVSAFCASALEYEGYKVGLYTSPHLRDFEERIKINGEAISRGDLVNLVDELKIILEEFPGITTFEIATAMAFIYFKREGVDIAVIEVGLGGRVDATNVITPLVSVITALYLEHTNILGDSLQEIALAKAGIIKPGIPVVLSPQNEDARQTVHTIAAQRDAPLKQIGEDFSFELIKSNLDKQVFSIKSYDSKEHTELEISLLGQHQLENATAAYAALQVLRGQGIDINENAIREGFANTSWPGRFEILNRNPPVVVDSAHNPDSARKIKETLEKYFPSRPVILVFGVSEDKNISGIIKEFLPGTSLVICSQSTHPRALDVYSLMEYFKPFDCPVKAVIPIGQALKEAVNLAGEDAVVLVSGSIFVAATARIAWFENFNKFQGV